MSTCLTDAQLHGLNAGDLNLPEQKEVLRHLEECQACAERNNNLRGKHNDLLDQVREISFGSALETRTNTEDPSSAPATPLTTLSIAGYDILRELSRGGQGVVYQAVQRSTKRKVAIKVLLAGEHASDSARRRFDREIELVARLKHPNIISIMHAGLTDGGQQYYVMDYVRGEPLNRYIVDNRPPLEDMLALFVRVCEGVQFAHQRGTIHRDLKPSNILVDVDGNPRLLDFGLARQTSGEVDTVMSMTQAVMGTLPYMSPEQTRGNPDEIDTRADIYALGVILYEMLTGHYPYPVVGQIMEVLKHIAETPPTPPSQVWTEEAGVQQRSSRDSRWRSSATSRTPTMTSKAPSGNVLQTGSTSRIVGRARSKRCPINDELQTVVLKTLSKERERRYQSAGELAADVDRYMRGEAIEAKRDSGWYVIKTQVRKHRVGVLTTAAIIMLMSTLGVYARNVQAQKAREVQIAEHIGLGRQRHAEGRLTEAFAQFELALSLNPDEPIALANKAVILKEQYFFLSPYAEPDTAIRDEAEALCDQALELAETDRTLKALWNLKAVLLYDKAEYKAAEDAAQNALDIDDKFHQAWSNLGKALAFQGRLDESEKAFERGARLSMAMNDNGRYDDNVVRYFATVQLFRGDIRAETRLLDAIDIDPKDTRNRLMLARLYLTLPEHIDHERALDEAKAAHAFAGGGPPDPRYSRILAQAHLANGNDADAVTYAEAALELGDEPSYGHFIATIAHFRLGNTAEARAHLTQARDNWPAALQDAAFFVQAKRGMLWFETALELGALRDLAESF